MSRYRGPVEKIERRFGVSLNMKGDRRVSGKSALNSRKYGPGQHGQNTTKISEYGIQLREKQKARFMYGISEKQFKGMFNEASRLSGNTGENLINLLESRLDNVVYRMGFASTRRFARQLVTHGHILVNDKKIDIPSYIVSVGQKISLSPSILQNKQVIKSVELNTQTGFVPWIDVDTQKLFGVFTRLPLRDEVAIPIEERLIVELYSK